ncbi:NADPH-dependent F420 reductase [Nocardia fluminea]|uniref:NADPH-dependent F420 reductase n=1 Tax=Nocardia fluminea TaxID=134984 RepID=UPI0036612548
MTTAIIGTGNIGSRLAADLAAGDQHFLLAGSSPAAAQALADTLDGHATVVSTDEAFAQADVIILAVWLDVSKDLITTHRDSLAGKIVVDPSNPIGPDGNGGFHKIIPADQSSGQLLAALLPPGASLVKAFGTLTADSLSAAARTDPRTVGFYAADDDAPGRTVAGLIEAAGFDPVLIGGLDSALRIEVGGDLHEMGGLGTTVTRTEALAVLH